MSKYVIKKDTSEVFLKDLSNGKWYFIGLTTKASSDIKVAQTLQRAGIGNAVVAVINTQKDITIDVATGLHYDSIAEMQNGTKFSTKAFVVPAHLNTTLTSNSFILGGTDIPIGNVVVVEDSNGIQSSGTFNPSTRNVTTTGLSDGTVEVYYTLTQSNTQVLDITKDTYPTNYEMWTHTISYNARTNQLMTNIYRHYYKVMPDGNEADAAEAGKNNPDSIKFTALVDDVANKYGEYVVIPVATTTSLASPTLTSDSTSNIINTAIDITFTDDATWRSAITQVLVNSVQIPVSDITLASGKITLVGSLFPIAGVYNIVVCSNGYTNSVVNQTITAS